MNKSKLEALNRIAQMKKDKDLADLARLVRRRDEAEAAHEQLTTDVTTARKNVEGAVEGNRTVDRFAGWAAIQQIALTADIRRLDGAIDTQKAQAALSVGRQDALQQVTRKLEKRS